MSMKIVALWKSLSNKSGGFRALNSTLLLACCLLPVVPVRAQRIPDAPQDLLYMYLQSLKLTRSDAGLLDELATHFAAQASFAARTNEVIADTLRTKTLQGIRDHVPARRLMLGFSVRLGNYHSEKKRFSVLYPVYGASRPNQPGPLGLVRTMGHALPLAVRAKGEKYPYSEYGQDRACTLQPEYDQFAPLTPETHFDVVAACDQNTTQVFGRYGSFYADNLPYVGQTLVPSIFRLNFTQELDWSYYDIEPENAASLITKLNRSGASSRQLWAEMIFDVSKMDTFPIKANPDDEGGPTDRHLTMGATFNIEPQALFVWAYPSAAPWNGWKAEGNFLFAKGNVKTGSAPPDGIVQAGMISKPLSSGSSAAQPNTSAACPKGLPADAALDRCNEQATLSPAGLYLNKDGKVVKLTASGTAPAAPSSTSPVRLPAAVSEAPGSNQTAAPSLDFAKPQ